MPAAATCRSAVALAVDHCLFGLGLHRVEIAIRPENAASLRVVEKLGFPEVGYAPRFLHIDGDWRDHRLFALTARTCRAACCAGSWPGAAAEQRRITVSHRSLRLDSDTPLILRLSGLAVL